MATDSFITFKYSDNVPVISLYIKSDSNLKDFILTLKGIVSNCQHLSMFRSWDYVVAEIVSKLVISYPTLVRISPVHHESETCNTIYRHVISIDEKYYSDKFNHLSNFVKIKSEYPMQKELIADCYLKDYPKIKKKC